MKIFVDFHSLKWAAPAWLLLYLSCLLLLWYKRKDWRSGYDLFFWIAVGGMLVLYCPLTFKALVPRFLPDFGEYERLGWVLFVIPVIAYTVTAFARAQASQVKKALFLCVCAVLLVIMGRPNTMHWYQRPESKYKIAQDAVDATDIIREDAGDERVTVSVQLISNLRRKDDHDPDFRLFYGIRQYEYNFRLRRCIIPPKDYDKEDLSLDGVLYRKSDYYIGPKDIGPVTRELDRLGYVPIGETDHYRVLRNQQRYDARQAAGEDQP